MAPQVMPPPDMTNNPNPYDPSSILTAVRTVVEQAVKPLADDLKEVKRDVSQLQINRVERGDVYDRLMIDKMMKDLSNEIDGIKELLKAQRESLLKTLTAISIVAGLLVLFAQHISIH